MLAAVSPALTTAGVALAGLGGVVLALLAPALIMRGTSAASRGQAASSTARWLLVFCLEVVACVLLFAAGKALGIVPLLTTPTKIGVVTLAALVLTGALGLAQRAFGTRT